MDRRQQILWEQTENGIAEVQHDSKLSSREALCARIGIARCKMLDVTVVSTKLDEDDVVFSPCICLFLMGNKGVCQLYSIFTESYAREEDDGKKTFILLRKASWDNKLDYLKFVQADDKLKYLRSGEQVLVKNYFFRQQHGKKLLNLVGELEKSSLCGLKFEKCTDRQAKWGSVELKLLGEDNSFVIREISYSPCSLLNEKLESWINGFVNMFEKIDFRRSIKPCDGISVSYAGSPLDFLMG